MRADEPDERDEPDEPDEALVIGGALSVEDRAFVCALDGAFDEAFDEAFDDVFDRTFDEALASASASAFAFAFASCSFIRTPFTLMRDAFKKWWALKWSPHRRRRGNIASRMAIAPW